MLRSLFSLDWRKSDPHLLLLSKFQYPKSVDELKRSDIWKSVLGEHPEKAIRRFLKEGMLERADLNAQLDYKFEVTELRDMLRKRSLSVSGQKNDLIQRLIESDREDMKQAVIGLTILSCSEHGREIAEQFLSNETPTRGFSGFEKSILVWLIDIHELFTFMFNDPFEYEFDGLIRWDGPQTSFYGAFPFYYLMYSGEDERRIQFSNGINCLSDYGLVELHGSNVKVTFTGLKTGRELRRQGITLQGKYNFKIELKYMAERVIKDYYPDWVMPDGDLHYLVKRELDSDIYIFTTFVRLYNLKKMGDERERGERGDWDLIENR